MKDSIKRIRLHIVESGLQYALSVTNNFTRKEFFAIEHTRVPPTQFSAYAKEIQSKNWHAPVLERLVKSGILIQENIDNRITYSVMRPEDVSATLADHKNGGLILSHFVFPNEVPAPTAASTVAAVLAAGPIDTEVEHGSLAGVPTTTPVKGTALVKESPVIEAADSEILITMDELLRRLLQSVVSLKDQNKINSAAIVDTIVGRLGSLAQTLSSNSVVLEEVPTALKNTDTRINGLSKRIDELESMIKGQRNVLDGNQAVAKKIADSLATFQQNDELTKAVKESTQNIEKLQDSLTRLTTEIRTKEQNKLDQLGPRVSALAEEIKNLGTEILTAAANMG